MELLILIVVWFAFFILTFRSPNAPKLTRLLFFLFWIGATGILGYLFLVQVLDYNPNPAKVRIANYLTENKLIDLLQIAPGAYDLDHVHRIDTDWENESDDEDAVASLEWLVFYQYDVGGASSERPRGPFGAAIYDPDRCRPPAILSFELIPASYDYLGQDGANVTVQNIMAFPDPKSANEDRPEVIIDGYTRGVVTDLNVFRKVGVEPNCFEMQRWRAEHPADSVPLSYYYENVGSFRGNYMVRRNSATIAVFDRDPLERSQFTIRKDYRPENGSYFYPGTQVLLPPVETTLAFGPAEPDDVPQVYYPEKAVLAFYLKLGRDQKNLEQAKGYLSPYAEQIYDIKRDPFGLSADPANPARARQKLARVLVYEIRYQPDIQAEQLHEDREVTVTLVGVNEQGQYDNAYQCQVTWTVVGIENPQALPYGCEWRLESYWTTCPAGQSK